MSVTSTAVDRTHPICNLQPDVAATSGAAHYDNSNDYNSYTQRIVQRLSFFFPNCLLEFIWYCNVHNKNCL